MRKVSGFTIIELVVVITILGILAAVALPKFFDIQNDARTASAAGLAGAIASASAVNYGAYLAKGSTVMGGVVSVTACTQAILGRLIVGGFPTSGGLSVTEISLATAGTSSGTVGLCGVFHPSGGSTTTATVIVVSA